MAKPGPRPKPLATIQRSGSSQVYKRTEDLDVPVDMPDCPDWLGNLARQIWDETVKHLFDTGVITLLDKGVLGLYCHSLSQFIQADKLCKKNYVITTKTGAKKPNPALEVANKAWEKVLKASKELGLTPAARAGLGVVGKREPDKSSGRFFKVS